jgi:ZIP family zinc transporter
LLHEYPLWTVLCAAWLAGLASWVGGLFAYGEGSAESEDKREFVHGMVAFGGCILVAAVAFALTPLGMQELSPWVLVLALVLLAGGLVFCGLDIYLSRRTGSRSQLMAMLLDFVPEALALGAVFGHDPRLGLLLALFIAAQNLPEGFNAFREGRHAGTSARVALTALLAISLIGPIAAGAGFLFLREQIALTAAIMAFAAGGILYLVFQGIAPQARMRHHRMPALGAVLGFLVGMVGTQLLA